MSQLYYGDNLEVLREHVADESVDLIYLDPPFNSNANYNILFKSPKGAVADSTSSGVASTLPLSSMDCTMAVRRRVSSVCSLAWNAAGVPVGTNTPDQMKYSTSMPNSLKVGTSGKAAKRAVPQLASGRNRPPRICPTNAEGPPAVIST